MKGKFEIEFEFTDYAGLIAILHDLASALNESEHIQVTRTTATVYDTDNKPFMTSTPIGATEATS